MDVGREDATEDAGVLEVPAHLEEKVGVVVVISIPSLDSASIYSSDAMNIHRDIT
jgi:hypothetical protein